MSGYTSRTPRGWLLHEALIHLDNLEPNTGEDTESSYTQTGPRPGVTGVGDPLGTFRPQVHHAQAADLDLFAVKAGQPAADVGGGLGYRVDGEASTEIRGWNDPNVVTSYRPVEWSTTTDWADVAAVTCPRSQKVVAIAVDEADSLPVSVWVWDPATRDWSARAEIDSASASGPCYALACDPRTGRLYAYEGQTAADVWYSDDDGTTWAYYGRVPSGTFDSSATRWRAKYDRNGTLLLLALDEGTGDYWQYASRDGLTFEEVDTGTAWGTHPSLCDTPSGLLVVVYRDLVLDARWITLTDAYEPISGRPDTILYAAPESVAACTDADGIVYVYVSYNFDRIRVSRILDNGVTLDNYTYDLVVTGGSIANNTDHRHFVHTVSASGGEIVALCTAEHTATTPTTDGSLVSLACGGWDSIEMLSAGERAARISYATNSDRDVYGVFLPTETLANQGWTHTGAANALVGGYHRYNATGAAISDSLTFAGHAVNALVLAELRVLSGGSLTTEEVFLRIVRRNGAVRVLLTLRLAATGFAVRDDSGAGTTLATVTWGMGTITEFALQTSGTLGSVWYRYRDSSVWLLAWQGVLGTDVTGATTDAIAVGTNAVTADLRVGLLAWSALGNLGINGHPLHGLTLTTHTRALEWGKAMPTMPYPLRDQIDPDGHVAHLSGSGGTARYQERWAVPADWDYGVREVHPLTSPSPAQKWRSADTSEQILTWDLGADSRLGHSWGVGLALVGANFRRAILEVSTSAAPDTFVELGAWNSRVVVSGTFTRQGNLVLPASGTSGGSMFFGAGWLRDGFVTLDPAGTPVNRRIKWNEGGGWVGSGVQSVLRLTEVDGTEPTSGTLHVHMNGGVLVVHQGAPTAYRRVRLRIPSQDCPDDFFELGQVVLGSLVVGGRQWGRGWSWRYVPLVREEEDDRGTIYVEPRGNPDEVYRRELTVSWQDGYQTTEIRAGAPGWLAASEGLPPLVADQDVWFQMAGHLRISRGGTIPCCPILEIPRVTGMVLDPTLWGVGRLGVGQPWQINHVQGREGRSEVYRGESLTWVELK